MWLLYRTRRLEADYAYRREVLERTGLVILDGKNMLGSQEGSQYVVEHALPSGGQGAVVDMDALPEADKTCDAPVEVDANATPHADAEKDIVDAEIIEPKPVEPEVTVAAAELVVEPEPVAEPVAEPIAEPVVESVADAAVEIVEPEAVKPEPHVVEAQIVAPEAETIEPEAEIAEPAVGDSTPENIAFEPQTVAIVHIAVRAISDSKDAVIEPETESKPELTLEPEPELIPEPAVDVVLAELVSEPELESNLEATPEPTLELKPEPISESIPEPVVQTDIPVTKPSAPQSPQTPQEPKVVVANPKPPVRHARLSDRQKRR